VGDPEEQEVEQVEGEPKLYATWMAALQAELMLGHLSAAGPAFPEANLYCHACITAMRSVTAMIQKALRHEPGFEEWYADVQDRLREDSEFVFLKDARNFVLKEGAVQLLMSFRVQYNGPLAIKLKGVGPGGPDVWVIEEGASEWVPADWRRLDGFKFEIPVRLARIGGLPEPPDRDLREMLKEKIETLRLIIHEAEARFDPENADPKQAAEEEREHGGPWRGG
jgi:hypothetical protein